jgi:hypothetical protein
MPLLYCPSYFFSIGSCTNSVNLENVMGNDNAINLNFPVFMYAIMFWPTNKFY